MERRKFLSTVGAGSVIGLAGCAGGDNGGSDDSTEDSEDEEDIECSQPTSDNLEDSLPDSNDYEQQGEVFTTEGEDQEDIEGTALAGYSGPDGEEFIFAVTEYSSSAIASEEAENATDEGSGEFGAIGYIRTGAFIFVGGGPDESSIQELMRTSPTLEGCVGDNIEFIGGSPSDQESVDAGGTGCTQAKLDEPGDTIRWDGYANGGTEIESVDITVRNVKDFRVSATLEFLFENEDTSYNPTIVTRTVTLEPNGSEELTITRTGLDSTRWDVDASLSCPS